MIIVPKNQEPVYSSLNDKELVTDPNKELVTELDILREEMGGLIIQIRAFIKDNRAGKYGYLSRGEIIDILEEIING
jgi:hypothetical protein